MLVFVNSVSTLLVTKSPLGTPGLESTGLEKVSFPIMPAKVLGLTRQTASSSEAVTVVKETALPTGQLSPLLAEQGGWSAPLEPHE